MDQVLVVGGIPIPSREPWFLAIIAIHVLAGMSAVGFGCAAMFSAKRSGRHPRSGSLYFWSLAVVCITMAVVVIRRWPHDVHLGALGVLAFSAAFVGRRARRLHRSGWRAVHIAGMGSSYVALLTAFYVDNGPFLPGWSRLPHLTFWLLPAAVGAPLILAALQRDRRRHVTPVV